MGWLRRHKGKLGVLLGVIGLVLLAHVLVGVFTAIEPPPVSTGPLPVTEQGDIRRAGRGYTVVRGGVRELFLAGTPEEMGSAHVSLLRQNMIDDEGETWALFAHFVPLAPLRALIMDISRVQYRHVDRGIPEPRRREIAAEASAYVPDPFASKLPTYQRLVFLHAMYDIALSFEHSPLIGCSAWGVGPSLTKDGHVLVGRAFDFEAGDVFDVNKDVVFYAEDGAIPVASVGWPGLSGVVTGVNLEGVMLVVHGGRARDPRTEGIPVVFSLRETLSRAHDTEEAIAILSKQEVMVSHIVFVADAKGRFAVVERAPGERAHARRADDPERMAVTNHFEGPLRGDPRDDAVRAGTTSIDRRVRADELLTAVQPRSLDVRGAVGILRDHKCAKNIACDLGDRRSLDALIATHGVIADLTDRVLWVSRGPHLSGAFVRFDLKRTFAKGHDPAADPAPETIDEDPILKDGRYDEGRARAVRPTAKQ
jgi:hypothetical protein